MEDFIAQFAHLSLPIRLAWLVGCIMFSWFLEGAYTFKEYKYDKWQHAKTNFTLLLFTMAINVGFGILTIGAFTWGQSNEVGILFLLNLPYWANLLVSFLLLDFMAQYFIHYLLHKIPWMWKFHMIHHSDTHLDASSGTRHHPGDFIFREIFALITCIIIGAPIEFYFFYRFYTIFNAYFTHANIVLPEWINKPLSYIFITPNMHKFHHHYQLPWTDSNYGNIFSFWDRIFGTLTYDDPEKVRFGVDTLADSEDKVDDIKFQLGIPFNDELHIK